MTASWHWGSCSGARWWALAFTCLPLSREADAMLLAFGCVAILAATVFLAAARKRTG